MEISLAMQMFGQLMEKDLMMALDEKSESPSSYNSYCGGNFFMMALDDHQSQ